MNLSTSKVAFGMTPDDYKRSQELGKTPLGQRIQTRLSNSLDRLIPERESGTGAMLHDAAGNIITGSKKATRRVIAKVA